MELLVLEEAMTIKEKIELEQEAGAIRLYKEGVFWAAYEQSAYAVWQEKKYKPTKKFVKVAGMEVISVGFPNGALKGLLDSRNFAHCQDSQDKCIVLERDTPIDKEEFLAWKDEVVCREENNVKNVREIRGKGVVERLQQFDLSNATPLECMNFLAELKRVM